MGEQSAPSQDAALPRDKTELMERIHGSRAELERLVNRLDAEQATAPGSDGWSVKDHLAHVAMWEQSLLALLEGRSRSAAIGVDQGTYETTDTDGLNAILHERCKALSLADALSLFRRSHEQVLAVLASMSDEDLFRPYSHYQPGDPPHNADPVVGWVAGNTFDHYAEHIGWIRALLARDGPAA